MTGLLMNNELETMWKEAVVAEFKVNNISAFA
jgi:hypothetical protein